MMGGKALSTPLPSYVKLNLQDYPKSDDDKALMANIAYSFVIGSLTYAMIVKTQIKRREPAHSRGSCTLAETQWGGGLSLCEIN